MVCHAEAMRHRGQPAVAARAIVAGGFGLFSSNVNDGERYLSAVRCGPHELLFSRRNAYQARAGHGTMYMWETLMRHAVGDGVYGQPHVVLHRQWYASHNAVFRCLADVEHGMAEAARRRPAHGVHGQPNQQARAMPAILGFSGRHRKSHEAESGVRRFIGHVNISGGEPAIEWEAKARHAPVVVSGRHPGCIERFGDWYPVCRFDGMLSTANLFGVLYLYARANTRDAGGGRSVQVVRSADGGENFGPFELVSFACGNAVAERGRHANTTDYNGFLYRDPAAATSWHIVEIYYWMAEAVGDGVHLVALFPATYVLGGNWGDMRGGIFACWSTDGMHWSMPMKLLDSEVHKRFDMRGWSARTADHPYRWHSVRTSASDTHLNLI